MLQNKDITKIQEIETYFKTAVDFTLCQHSKYSCFV